MKKEDIKSTVDFLQQNDYLEAGNTIDSETLMQFFGTSDTDSMEYIGPLILVAKEIERRTGLFCKLVEKCIYIFNVEECAAVAKRRGDKAQRINKQTYDVLLKTDLTSLQNKDAKTEHMHQLNIFSMLNRSSRLIMEKTQIYEID